MAKIIHLLPDNFFDVDNRTAEEQIIDKFLQVDIPPPEHIVIDGYIHRFKTSDKKNKKDGWYVFFPGEIVCGKFGCWRTGLEVPFRQELSRELTAVEQMVISRNMSQAKKKRDEVRAKELEAAESAVLEIWENANYATDEHPYLKKKKVKSHNIKITGDGRLVIPMFKDGELKSLQYISASGDKMFHSGAAASGAFFIVGSVHDAEKVYMAEGYADAATIHEQTSQPCIVAFSASNFPKLAKDLKDQFKNLTIVADHDDHGVGERYAKESGLPYIMPPIKGMDANDYFNNGHDLNALLTVSTADAWLVSAMDFCQQPAPIKWLIKGLLQEYSLMMAHGPSGAGKTFVVLDWCMSIASGRGEWFGQRVKTGNVVYLAGEGHHGLRSRVALWCQENKPQELNFWISKSGCDFDTKEGFEQVIHSLRELSKKPDLIVIDTLHRFMSGDENTAKDARTMIQACSELMAYCECSVLLVHHTGVSDEAQHRARGSSSWKGALDIELSVTRQGGGNTVRIKQCKAKDSEEIEPFYAELLQKPIDGWLDEDGEQVTSVILQPVEAPQEQEKSDPKLVKYTDYLMKAWHQSGQEIEQNLPYISRSAFKRFLVDEVGMTEKTVQRTCKPSGGGIAEYLLQRSYISQTSHGWVITDDTLSSLLLITKGADN